MMRVCGSSTPRARGFTLIELLVVVSIIALLISILLPSMKTAREQAKLIACQSNMRNINVALLTYITEYDALPVFYVLDGAGCICGWCSWSFGGWLGTNAYWDEKYHGCFRIPAYQRPLTAYMVAGEVTAPEAAGGGQNPPTLRESSDFPIFRCPSDEVSSQWQWRDQTYGTAGVKLNYSAYDDVGTSFMMNFYWWPQTDKDPGVDRDGDGVIEPLPGKCDREKIHTCAYNQEIDWPCRFRQGRQIWRKYAQRDSSRFVTLVEDPFDYAIVERIQVMGFHRRFSRHNMAFLDGHVSYMQPDTRKMLEWDWTVLDESMEAVSWP